MTDAAAHHELAGLLTALREGVLPAEGADRVAALLSGDAGLCELYAEQMWLWAELELAAEPEARRLPIAGAPGEAAARTTAVRGRTTAWRIAAAVAIAGAAVAMYFGFPLGATAPQETGDEAAVGVLVYSDATVTSDTAGVLSAGDAIEPQWVRTQGGETELALRSGTQITLSGAGAMRLDGPMRVMLGRGRATFDCPPAAHGFTVELPGGGSVIDLGTRFTIHVDEAGTSVVRVLDGRVSLSGPGRTIAAETGSGWRFDPAGGLTRLSAETEAIVIESHDADGAIYRFADGRVGVFAVQDLIVGAATGPANYNGVVFFRLPEAVELDGARATLTLSSVTAGALRGANADVWGLGYVRGTPKLDPRWVSVDPDGRPTGPLTGAGDIDRHKPARIADDIVAAGQATTAGWTWTSDAAQSEMLTVFLRELYDRGARPGDWAVIRINPDADTLAGTGGLSSAAMPNIRFGGSHRSGPSGRAVIRITHVTPPAERTAPADPSRPTIETGDDR